MARGDKLDIYKDKADKWRWRLTAANNEKIGRSGQGYKNRVDCVGNIARLGIKTPPKKK